MRSFSVTILVPVVHSCELNSRISISENPVNINNSGVLNMNNDNEERELVPVRVKPNKTSGREEILDDIPDPEEIGQQVIPRRWYVF